MVDSAADEPPLSSSQWAKNLEAQSASLQNPHHHPEPQATTYPSVVTQSTSKVSPDAVHGVAGRFVAHQSPQDAIKQNTHSENTDVVVEKGDGTQPPSLEPGESKVAQASLVSRFVRDVKLIIRSSWINWLLLIVPVAIILGALADWGHIEVVDQSIVFAINAIAIVPLASLLAFATESVASKMGDTVGALMNVTFGNAVELIIFIIALVNGQVRIVQAAAIGSILSNLLIILGMSFLLGGLRFREQLYNSTVSQMSACLLCLSVISLLLPTAFHASFDDPENGTRMVLQVSRGTSIVLLLVYALYLVFSLKSHSFMYASTPQHIIDEEAANPGVLTQMLLSSSDSSSTSDSDSDSSRGSRNTAMRIKRAFRRKRRTSSPSSKAQSTHESANIRRTPTEATSITAVPANERDRHGRGSGSVVDEPVLSGDEADLDVKPRVGRHRTNRHTIARDFESATGEVEDEKTWKHSRRHRKRSKRSKHVHRDHDNLGEKSAENNPSGNPSTVRSVPAVQFTAPDATAHVTEKRPLNLRNISSHVNPAFFPHHASVARPLALQAIQPRPSSRSPSRRRLARSSSMPDMIHPTISNDRAAIDQSHAHGMNLAAESQIEVVEDILSEGKRHLSKTSSVILLLITTGFVAICAEFLVGSIDHIVSGNNISQAFLGLIILPLVGNAAEHVTAVTVAYKNKMDLAIGIALGSSIQVAILITPFMVVLGWIIDKDFSLYFSLFETVSLFASTIIVGFLLIDGRSNYLEGALLIAAYVIIALSAFYYPNCGLSTVSGLTDGSEQNCSSA